MRSGGGQPNILQQAEVTTMSNEFCVGNFSYNASHIDETMLCAQGRTESGHIIDGCQGDSGGPLVCEDGDGKFTLFGAVSWGFGCAKFNFPGVYARVHHSLDWIYETMAAVGAPGGLTSIFRLEALRSWSEPLRALLANMAPWR